MDICSFGGQQQPRHDSDGLGLIRLQGPATAVETTCLNLLIPRTYVVALRFTCTCMLMDGLQRFLIRACLFTPYDEVDYTTRGLQLPT